MEVKTMSKISLSDLAQRLAEKSGISQQDAEQFIRKMFDVANEGLQSDKLVKMKWLGTFKVMAVKDRESVDVNTGERIIIEGRDKISFTPDNILKEIVNKPFAQFETVVVNDGVNFDEIDRKFENAEEVSSPEEVFESKNDSVSENVSDTVDSSVVAFGEQESLETSGVIDFLDEENDAPVSDEMIVIGEELPRENAAEPEEKKPEVSEPAAIEPAVFKPEVSEPEKSEPATSESEEMEYEVSAQNEVESVVSDEEKESALTEETPIAKKVPSGEENTITETPIAKKVPSGEENTITETPIAKKVPSDEENSITETPIAEKASSDEETSSSDEVTDKRHIVLPRSLVVAASVVFLAMIGGFGWFAFNYGKMAAQRDHLALQLDNYQQVPTEKKASAKSAPTQEEILRKKAMEDSVRMAQASEAVKKAENAEQNMDAAPGNQSIDAKSAEAKKDLETKKLAEAKKLADAKRKVEAKKLAEAKKQQEAKKLAEAKKKEEVKKKEEARKQAEKHSAQASSKYDQDARVRTGAYRIIGVSEVVTAREGQSIKSLSQKYLGPGMECYVEALNGTSQLKPGQKVKIPKLELKKKK